MLHERATVANHGICDFILGIVLNDDGNFYLNSPEGNYVMHLFSDADRYTKKDINNICFGALFSLWRWVADIHLKLLNCVVSGASFLTVGLLECDIAHCWTVAELYQLYNRSDATRCILWLTLHLAAQYVPMPVTRGDLVSHWYAYAPPRSTRTLLFLSQYHCKTILWPCIRWCLPGGFLEKGSCFYWKRLQAPLLFSMSLLSFYGLL